MIKKNFKSISTYTAVLFLMAGLLVSCGKKNGPDLKGKVGDKISTGLYMVSITSITPRYSVGFYLSEKAKPGSFFILVNFYYKNISKGPISSFNTPKIKIIDPNNVPYDAAIAASISYAIEINLDKKISSDINPGIYQRDAVVFEVSREKWFTKGWKLLIETDKKIEIAVK